MLLPETLRSLFGLGFRSCMIGSYSCTHSVLRSTPLTDRLHPLHATFPFRSSANRLFRAFGQSTFATKLPCASSRCGTPPIILLNHLDARPHIAGDHVDVDITCQRTNGIKVTQRVERVFLTGTVMRELGKLQERVELVDQN